MKQKDYFVEEIGEIRALVSRDPSYTELPDPDLREKIDQMLDLRVRQCRTSSPERAAY